MSFFELNITEVVRFYDEDVEARTHSNSIKTLAGEELGLALLKQHLTETARAPAQVYSTPATKGARLDGWIKVAQPKPVLFQIEVKSWSMHGYGSAKSQLSVDASDTQVSEYKKLAWSRYWKDGEFTAPNLQKVLRRMNHPKSECKLILIEPIACLWAAVHPNGLESPFFTVPTTNSDFTEMHVFSMSAYLRNLLNSKTRTIKLELPKTAKRIEYLNKLLSKCEVPDNYSKQTDGIDSASLQPGHTKY